MKLLVFGAGSKLAQSLFYILKTNPLYTSTWISSKTQPEWFSESDWVVGDILDTLFIENIINTIHPDVLINLPASILMCYKKGAYLSMIMKNLNNVKNLKNFNGFYAPRFHKVGLDFNYSIDKYQAEGRCNKNDNLFIKSEYSSFQDWKRAIIDTHDMKYLAMRGMFMICRENIKYISLDIYNNLLTSLSVGDNIENGHFAERIWAHLFRQYSFDTIKTNNENDEKDGEYEILCSMRNVN